MRLIFIPDTQVKKGVPTNHIKAAANYCVKHKPDVIVVAGDWWDMPSLNKYASNVEIEGQRILEDIKAGKEAMDLFMSPFIEYNDKARRGKRKLYSPRLIFTTGNHDPAVRIPRLISDHPILDGILVDDTREFLESYGFEVYDFLEVVEIEGIRFSHYHCNPHSAKKGPLSGAIDTMLKNAGFSFVQGHTQGIKLGKHYLMDGTRRIGIVAGCLTPDHKVLTADFKYVPIGDLKVGDRLVSFDENSHEDGNRSRRYKTGTLLNTCRDIEHVYSVKLESGKEFKVTKDHVWLRKNGSMYQWVTTANLRKGTSIPKFFDEWDTLDSFEAGWLSGMYDGEGSLYIRKTTGGYAGQLAISQKEGEILDKLEDTLVRLFGFDCTSDSTHGLVKQLRFKGGLTNITKFLGSVRPQRLLNKMQPEFIGRINCPDSRNDKVVSVEYLGKQEIVRTDVDCKTFICEGYPHHNSFYQHQEDFMGVQGNRHWHGIIVLNEVRDGGADLCEVSLEYLMENYLGEEAYG